jgi:hypothetical protein
MMKMMMTMLIIMFMMNKEMLNIVITEVKMVMHLVTSQVYYLIGRIWSFDTYYSIYIDMMLMMMMIIRVMTLILTIMVI